MAPVIRPATPADQAAIADLHTVSWQQSYRGVLPDGWLDGALAGEMRARWQGRLTAPRPGWLVLVAVLDGGLAGFFAAGPDPDDLARDLIDNLHVQPALRSHGIGAALMREGSDRLGAIGRGPAILWVVDDNRAARAFYRDLGGAEGPPEPHEIARGRTVATVPFRWDRLHDIAAAARRRLARRLAPPLALTAAALPSVSGAASGADHPVAAAAQARLRVKQRLGDAFGLTGYGVNRVVLDPGCWSSIPHWHSHEDEFVHVLEGTPTLVSGAEERLLHPGDCAGFPAGLDRPHHLENRSAAPVVCLEIGARLPDRDEVDYPGQDLRIARLADGRRVYVHRDGRAYDGG